MRCLVFLATAACLAILVPAVANAQSLATRSSVEQAAASLRSDNVYSDHEARPGLSGGEKSRLRRAIAAANSGAVYVAVLPSDAVGEAGGDVGALAREIGTRVRRPGTYAVVAGTQIGA